MCCLPLISSFDFFMEGGELKLHFVVAFVSLLLILRPPATAVQCSLLKVLKVSL